jgi:hypothetical protein
METALIALASALAGILLSNLISLLIDIRRRKLREIELAVAIHAEIVAGGTGTFLQQANLASSHANIFQSQGVVPFAIPDETDFVFSEIKKDITVLPTDVIHSVVALYKAGLQVNAYLVTFRDAAFLNLEQNRQAKLIEQYFDLVVVQQKLANAALAEIETFAQKNKVDLKSRHDKLSRILTENRVLAQNKHPLSSDGGTDTTGHDSGP